MAKWAASTSTKSIDKTFKTKREAIEWARNTFLGIFFVWRIK